MKTTAIYRRQAARLLATGAAAFGLSLVVQAGGFAQPSQMQSPQQQTQSAVQKAQEAEQNVQALASQGQKLIGKDVYGADNQRLGPVEDVVIGQDSKVNAVLVDIGGFLGIGSKTVALPLEQLRPEGERIVAADLTKEQAKAIPEYKTPEEQDKQQPDSRS